MGDEPSTDGIERGLPEPENGPDPWCTWCHVEPEDGRLPFRILGEDGRWPPAFCSLECAARWGNAAHQDRIYHTERQDELRTDGGAVEDGIDRSEIEGVAKDLRKMAVSLGRNGAISDELAESLHDKHCRLLESLPSEVEVHRSVNSDTDR